MECSGEDANCKIIDPAVGGLVWVRRRNGSWWPGRILGPDELPESCLISPRSGTPVKLLGREDASVDWYNLEKSKRVKPFRCGEYDECIEKAKASAANSCKKAVKYARREDAILHALELESAQLSKTCPESSDREELPITFHPDQETQGMSDKSSSFEDNSSSPHELTQSSVSFEEPCHIGASVEPSMQQGRKRCNPGDSEDDGNEGTKKRMRGLEDLGVGCSSFKKRRSQGAHIHEILRRKDRRRQLTKVLESSAMVNVPVTCEELAYPTASELESNDSKRSFSMAINNHSDSTGDASNNATFLAENKGKESEISTVNDSSERLFDVPLTGEENQNAGISTVFVSFASQKPAQSSQSSLVETLSIGNDEIQESGATSSGAANIDDICHRIDTDTSKWQLKGKRNSRNKSKNKKEDSGKFDDEPTEISVMAPQRLMPYRQSRFTVNPKYEPSDFAFRKHGIGTLYDVNVEVKAVHRSQHVPYISLMSKLNGQPIIGHPLVVEPLDDGGSHLLNGASSCELDRYPSGEDVHMVQETEPKPVANHSTVLSTHDSPKKSPKKPRRNGFLSNKKIRRLSSLNGAKRRQDEDRKSVLSVEKLKGPSVACVPLKVVFSRIFSIGVDGTVDRKTSITMPTVSVIWQKEVYPDVKIDTAQPPHVFKCQLYKLTGVPPERQKIMVKGELLKDDSDWLKLEVKEGEKLMMMETADDMVKDPEKGPLFRKDFLEDEQPASMARSAGLFNLGNTSYINSTMQCLHSVPELKSALAEYPQSGKNDKVDQSSHHLTIAIRDLFNLLDKNIKPVAPTQFWMVLRKKYPQFGQLCNGSFMQQDAKECWMEILYTLSEALRSPCSSENLDTVKGLFGIDLVSRILCSESGEESIETETVYSLKCHVSHDINLLHEGLKHGLKSELEKASLSLGRSAVYLKDSHINGLPRYLTIQFVRFFWKRESNQQSKILSKVNYPLELDIFDLCSDDLCQKMEASRQESSNGSRESSRATSGEGVESDRITQLSGLYDLVAVLSHKGTSADSGHYVAWVKQDNGKWIQFDDDILTPQTEEDILKLSGGGDWHTAYICMYKARVITM